MNESTRILIVDDHVVVAESLQALLSRQPDFVLSETADRGSSALRVAGAHRPDVVLMDQNLAGESGVAVAAAILAQHKGTAVVMLTGGMTQDELIAAIEVGVAGYLIKTSPVTEIVKAIRRAAAGEILIPPVELAALLRLGRERARDRAERQRTTPKLTPREREVLSLMAEAANAQRIADRMGISLNTARGHIQRILEKMGAHSRLEAVVRADALGILTH